MANDNETPLESALIHQAGAEIYSSLMISALIVTLIQSRAIDPAMLRENVDTVLLGLERRAPAPGGLSRAFGQARERLHVALKMIDGTVPGAAPGAAG